jgi:transcriptional regulator with XRE-family HTH domain
LNALQNESHTIDVGARLRELREERGVSMRALARRSGLSANALSMIERGLTSPSVGTLNKLAGALEVPIVAFFHKEEQKYRVVFCKAAERPRLKIPLGTWEGLGGERFVGRVEAFLLTLEAGGSSGQHGMLHTGHEFVFCQQGQLEYTVEGQQYLLEPGDSLIFAAQMLHFWRNPGLAEVKAIVVISSFGENERPGEFHLASRPDAKNSIELGGEKEDHQPLDAAGFISEEEAGV